MEVVEAFYVRGVAASVFLVYFDLVAGEAGWDDESAVVDAEGGPGGVHFGACVLAEDVFLRREPSNWVGE